MAAEEIGKRKNQSQGSNNNNPALENPIKTPNKPKQCKKLEKNTTVSLLQSPHPSLLPLSLSRSR